MPANDKEREAIINAIRVLRSRRVRPSGQKISWYLKRQLFFDDADTMEALDELVRTGDISRVDYKGAISYRVAKSRTTVKPSAKAPTLDGHAVRRAILSAVTSCGPSGGTRYRIAACLQTRGLGKLVSRLDVILQREARVGVLTKKVVLVEEGKSITLYVIGNRTKDTDDDTQSTSSDSDVSVPTEKTQAPFVHLQMQLELLKQKNCKIPRECDETSAESSAKSGDKTPDDKPSLEETDKKPHAKLPKRGRPKKLPVEVKETHPKRKGRPPSKRAKKEKKVYDPSEGNASKKRRQSGATSRELSPTISDNCSVCNTNESDILCCTVCSVKAHPKCVGYDQELANKILKCPWTCMDCRSCSICRFNHKLATLIFCDKCDRAFHLKCHSPPLTDSPQGVWVCFVCLPSVQSSVYDSMIPWQPTPVSSPEGDENSSGSSENAEVKVPSVASWNVATVVEYFQNNGFERFANIFAEQEIEGAALLILSRDDVVKGFGLKLGPALKMFRQIRILQTRMPCPPFL